MTKVLYNDRGDGNSFSYSWEFQLAVLKKFPPHTDIGKKIFNEANEYVKKWNSIYRLRYIEASDLDIESLENYQILFDCSIQNKYDILKQKLKTAYINFAYIKQISTGNIYSFADIITFRDLEPLVEYAIEYGLDKCSDNYSKIKVYDVPQGYEYSIINNDGRETIIVTPPYKDIINDLINYIDNKEFTDYKSEFSKMLINKEKCLNDL